LLAVTSSLVPSPDSSPTLDGVHLVIILPLGSLLPVPASRSRFIMADNIQPGADVDGGQDYIVELAAMKTKRTTLLRQITVTNRQIESLTDSGGGGRFARSHPRATGPS
jgi:hypothetical protein